MSKQEKGWIEDDYQLVVFTGDMVPGSTLRIYSGAKSNRFMTLEVLGLFQDTDPLVVVRGSETAGSSEICTGILLGSFVYDGHTEVLEPGHVVQGRDLALECPEGYERVGILKGRMELVLPKIQCVQMI